MTAIHAHGGYQFGRLAEHLLARDFKRGDTIQVRKNGAKLDFVRKETEKDSKDSKEKNVQDKADKPVEA